MFGAFTILALVGALVLLIMVIGGEVGGMRSRVERFARKQSLPITVGNGDIVIGYLAVTRRWRRSGLLVGLALTIGYSQTIGSSVTHEGLHVNFLALFVGWFVGAVIAEWRISTAASGSRRVASLAPRRLASYLPPSSWVAPALVFAGAAAAGLVGLVAIVISRHRVPAALIVSLAALVLVVAVIRVVVRHVLSRPQPQGALDVLAADDAIRSRSLRVLAGSSLALGGYLLATVLAAASWYAGAGFTSAAGPFGFAAVTLLPLMGVITATGSGRPRRDRVGVEVGT